MNKYPIKIIIADDNKLFGEALKDTLNIDENFLVIKTCTTIKEIIECVAISDFDILILDINFNGTDSLNHISEIKKSKTNFCILVLTTLNNNFIKQKAFDYGVDFFAGKDADINSLKSIIKNAVFNFSAKKKHTVLKKINIDNNIFTKRKLEILQALYKFSNDSETEIAKKIHISLSALKTHKRELFEITNTKSTPGLIKYGIKKGLLLP